MAENPNSPTNPTPSDERLENVAPEEILTIGFREEFYRDGFGKVLFVIVAVIIAIAILIALSLYLYLHKPKPVVFPVDNEWRVKPLVPLDQANLATPDLLQWVTTAVPKAFSLDFVNYNALLKQANQYFTAQGWKNFLNQLNIYANYNNVQTYKLFVNGSPAGAPFVVDEGLLSGRYAWWVQMPINITYAGLRPPNGKLLTLQVLVVRVPTTNNLSGVGIDNIIVASSTDVTS